MDFDNIMLLTDNYKVTHWRQYPKGAEIVYSYLESRGGQFDKTVMFGLQYIIKKYLTGKVITKKRIDEAEKFFTAHLGDKYLFNREGWEYILKTYNGYLPIRIMAVPEGTLVGTHNVLVTVENTDPKCYWLTNYIETLLVEVWYPITVATLSYHIKKIIMKYLEETGDPNLIDFKLHDFGFRGVSSVESAGIGGCAHLVNFKGTDTIAALIVAQKYYDCLMAGFSIPVSEHSTMTSWGRENEDKAMENMLDQYPKGLIACVSDSFNIFLACRDIWGTKLKAKIMARDGTLVVRQDPNGPNPCPECGCTAHENILGFIPESQSSNATKIFATANHPLRPEIMMFRCLNCSHAWYNPEYEKYLLAKNVKYFINETKVEN